MYRLTERRKKHATSILDKYRAKLHGTGSINVGKFEKELRDCWKVGYQELKSIFEDLLKIGHYRYLAAYYMQHSNAVGVVMEFQKKLADLYGVKSYDSPERKAKQAAFWQRFIQTN